MSRKTCSLEEKLSAVKSYLEGKSSLRQAAQEHGVWKARGLPDTVKLN
jgi:transposase-like protein